METVILEGLKRWWSILSSNPLLVALFSVIVTIVGAYWYTNKSPRLYFTVSDALPVKTETENMAFYRYSVVNEGNKEAVEVACVIKVPDTTIRQHQIKLPPGLKYKEQVKGDTMEVELSSINPGESVDVSLVVFAAPSTSLPKQIIPSVRGRDVTGELKSVTSDRFNVWVIMGVGLSVCALYAGSRAWGQNKAAWRDVQNIRDGLKEIDSKQNYYKGLIEYQDKLQDVVKWTEQRVKQGLLEVDNERLKREIAELKDSIPKTRKKTKPTPDAKPELESPHVDRTTPPSDALGRSGDLAG